MARAQVDRADLVVAFFTVDHLADKERLVGTLKRFSGTDRIIGSSAAGVLTAGGEIEGEPGLAVLALRSDEIHGKVFLFHPLRGRDDSVGADIGRQMRGTAGPRRLS
ncbi:MAG TPA: FIST N-terminal domain-containing protein, partial [candidate division Zixibacteria bacterium]|nr:FIST N-terminal domain-containing protein [candidate division Zixibacteria bacterium]